MVESPRAGSNRRGLAPSRRCWRRSSHVLRRRRRQTQPATLHDSVAQNDLKVLIDGLQSNGGFNIQADLETGLVVIAVWVNTKACTTKYSSCQMGTNPSREARHGADPTMWPCTRSAYEHRYIPPVTS
jgi:hypothetical protein